MKFSSMNRACTGAAILGLAAHALSAEAQSSANYRVDAVLLGAGAATASSASYSQQASVGAAVAGGRLTGATGDGEVGFWYAASSLADVPVTPPAPSTPANPSTQPPASVEAPSNAETTLRSAGPVNAAVGSTLVIPVGAEVSGAVISLPTMPSGTQSAPVSFKIGGQILSVTSAGADTVVTLKNVMIHGVDTPVLAITSGSVRVHASGGQPLLTMSNGITLTAGDGGTTVHAGKSNRIAVTSGYIILPANAFSAGNGFAAIKDGKIYTGEVAEFDNAGLISSVRLGSLAKDAGSLGDPLTVSSGSGLLNQAVVPNLGGKVARLSDTQNFADTLAVSLGQGFAAQGQNSDGVLRFSFAGRIINALPVGSLLVDTSRPDGFSLRADGAIDVVTGGVITTFVPAVGNFAQLAGQFAKLDPASLLSVLADGQLRVQGSNVGYAFRPAWLAQATDSNQAGISADTQGYAVYQDGSGSRQTLYPAFAEQGQLSSVLQAVDATAEIAANGDGSYRVKLKSGSFTLLPDYTVGPMPADQAGQRWWQDAAGKLYLNSGDGKNAQGFRVR